VLRIFDTLTPAVITMGTARDPGTRGAVCEPYGDTDAAFAAQLVDLLTGKDDELLAAWVEYQEAVD